MLNIHRIDASLDADCAPERCESFVEAIIDASLDASIIHRPSKKVNSLFKKNEKSLAFSTEVWYNDFTSKHRKIFQQ